MIFWSSFSRETFLSIYTEKEIRWIIELAVYLRACDGNFNDLDVCVNNSYYHLHNPVSKRSSKSFNCVDRM